jgi:predicted ester cyclase
MNTFSDKEQTVLSTDELRNFYHNYVAAANSRDFEAISKMVNENVIVNEQPQNRDGVIAGFKALVEAVPDMTWHIEDLVIEADRIAARLRDTGTPGETTFFGSNPKGIAVEFPEFGSYKIADGRFVEMSYLIDVAGISQQISI